MPEGWSVRVDVNGVEWYSQEDGVWYFWLDDVACHTPTKCFGEPVFEEKADA